MNKTAMTILMVMLTATGALAQDAATQVTVRPAAALDARTAAVAVVAPVAPAVAPMANTPAPTSSAATEPAGEFAGATMLRFLEKTVDAVREGGCKNGVPTGTSVQMAAY